VEGVGGEAEVGEKVVKVQALLLARWIDLPAGRNQGDQWGPLVLLQVAFLLLIFTP